jgi:iron complex transport system substrate-binding protein
MRKTHGWVAGMLAALILTINPAASSPRRIVSTFLCTDEYVFRMVPRAEIAALSFEAADRHPVVSTIADAVTRARIPTIRPSAETVMNYAPDLVVMYAGTMPALHAALARAHVKVLDVPWANSLADVRRVTVLMGEKLGAPDRAAEMLAEMNRKIARAKAHAPQPPVRTLIYEANGYSGTGAMTDELMADAGLIDVVASLRPTRLDTIPIENVLANPPGLLILSGDRKVTNSRADLVPHHPALKAFKGTIAWAKLTPLLCPGPWSADAVETFAALGAKAGALAHRKVQP